MLALLLWKEMRLLFFPFIGSAISSFAFFKEIVVLSKSYADESEVKIELSKLKCWLFIEKKQICASCPFPISLQKEKKE